MKNAILRIVGSLILLTSASCNSTTQPTRQAELTVTYEGKVIKHEKPTWHSEAQLREALKIPGKKYLIFGAPWCKACNFLRTALDQGKLMDKVLK